MPNVIGIIEAKALAAAGYNLQELAEHTVTHPVLSDAYYVNADGSLLMLSGDIDNFVDFVTSQSTMAGSILPVGDWTAVMSDSTAQATLITNLVNLATQYHLPIISVDLTGITAANAASYLAFMNALQIAATAQSLAVSAKWPGEVATIAAINASTWQGLYQTCDQVIMAYSSELIQPTSYFFAPLYADGCANTPANISMDATRAAYASALNDDLSKMNLLVPAIALEEPTIGTGRDDNGLNAGLTGTGIAECDVRNFTMPGGTCRDGSAIPSDSRLYDTGNNTCANSSVAAWQYSAGSDLFYARHTAASACAIGAYASAQGMQGVGVSPINADAPTQGLSITDALQGRCLPTPSSSQPARLPGLVLGLGIGIGLPIVLALVLALAYAWRRYHPKTAIAMGNTDGNKNPLLQANGTPSADPSAPGV